MRSPFAWKHWEKHNPEAPPNGVRTCPWDVNFLLVPILDKEYADIAGYGKMSGGRCLEVSYTKEGEKEWMSFIYIEGLYGPKKASELRANGYFNTRTLPSGKVEYKVTECMLALLFFPWPPTPCGDKVCVGSLMEFIDQIGVKIDVYRT